MVLHLASIAEEFEQEVDAIQACFLRGTDTRTVAQSPMPYTPLADGCLVSLWDAWNRFIRELMLGCASGESEGQSGVCYTPSSARAELDALRHLETEKQAGGKSYALAYGRRGEPKWYLAAHSFELGTTLGLQNEGVIGAALTASQISLSLTISVANPWADLQCIRNYVAHKSVENLRKVQLRLAISSHASVDAFLACRTAGGSMIFCDWADSLVAVAHNATN